MFILFVVSPVDSIKRGRQTENYLASEIYVQEILLLIHDWPDISAVLEIMRIPLENRDKTSFGSQPAWPAGISRFLVPQVATCHREGKSCWAVPSVSAAKPNLLLIPPGAWKRCVRGRTPSVLPARVTSLPQNASLWDIPGQGDAQTPLTDSLFKSTLWYYLKGKCNSLRYSSKGKWHNWSETCNIRRGNKLSKEGHRTGARTKRNPILYFNIFTLWELCSRVWLVAQTSRQGSVQDVQWGGYLVNLCVLGPGFMGSCYNCWNNEQGAVLENATTKSWQKGR